MHVRATEAKYCCRNHTQANAHDRNGRSDSDEAAIYGEREGTPANFERNRNPQWAVAFVPVNFPLSFPLSLFLSFSVYQSGCLAVSSKAESLGEEEDGCVRVPALLPEVVVGHCTSLSLKYSDADPPGALTLYGRLSRSS